MRIRYACALVALLAVATTAPAQIDIRNISSVSVDAFFDQTLALDVNQVVLFDIASWLSGEVKVQRQDSPVLHETTLSVAPIFIVSNYNYIIVRYGLGIGTGAEESADTSAQIDSRSFSHDLTVDANYETPSIYANIALRGSYYPDDDYWFVLPSAGIRVPLADRLSILGRYFFSYNSEQAISNAVLTEGYLELTDRLQLKAGGTASLDLSQPAGDAVRERAWEFSGITGLSYRVRPTLSLRYHLEYLGRLNRPDGIRNILVLDATF